MRTLGFALFYLLAALGAVFLIVIGLAVVDVLAGQQHVRQAGQGCVVHVVERGR